MKPPAKWTPSFRQSAMKSPIVFNFKQTVFERVFGEQLHPPPAPYSWPGFQVFSLANEVNVPWNGNDFTRFDDSCPIFQSSFRAACLVEGKVVGKSVS